MLIFSALILGSCSPREQTEYSHRRDVDYIPEYNDSITDLSAEQEAAFDALNTLQTNTDVMRRLYSTFPGIQQPFYPPDTMIVISQKDFLRAMQEFANKYCTKLPLQRRNELVTASVRSQAEYNVLWCNTSKPIEGVNGGLAYDGVWIMPNILGRRDLILEW